MITDKLNKLQAVVRTRYMLEQKQLSNILRREQRLRSELQQLDQHAKAFETQTPMTMRALGADILWKSWLGRKKSELNMQLAQSLVEKEVFARQVRKAYGKVLVTEELLTQKTARSNEYRSKKSLQDAIENHLMAKR